MVGPVNLKRAGRQRTHVRDARVGAQCDVEPGAAGAEEELILRRRPGSPPGTVRMNDERRDFGHTTDVGRRQQRIERLCHSDLR